MTNLIFLFAVITLFGCNSSKKVTDQNETTAATENTMTPDANYRFSVSFISIGAGTDKNAIQQFDAYIAEYQQKNKLKLSFEITKWGREGEIDYCLKLSELDKKKQELFITKTKETLQSSSLVRYKENAACRQK
jgi:hypothetical protein